MVNTVEFFKQECGTKKDESVERLTDPQLYQESDELLSPNQEPVIDEVVLVEFNYGVTKATIRGQAGTGVFNVDWHYWLDLAEWTPEQAVCLLFGIDTDALGNHQCRDLLVKIFRKAETKGNMSPYLWKQFGIDNNLPFPMKIRDIQKPSSEQQAENVEHSNDGLDENITRTTQLNLWLRTKWDEWEHPNARDFAARLKPFAGLLGSPVKKYHGWYIDVAVEWQPKWGSPTGSWGKRAFSNKIDDFKRADKKVVEKKLSREKL